MKEEEELQVEPRRSVRLGSARGMRDAREARRLEEKPEAASAGELAKTAAEFDWVHNMLQRDRERQEEIKGQPLEMTPEVLGDLQYDYNKRELEHLAGARTLEGLERRKEHIAYDREVSELFENAGLKGTLVRLGVNVADPVGLAMLALPSGVVGRGSMAARTAKSIIMGGAEGAAWTAYANTIDTQGTLDDVVMSALLSGALAGVITTGVDAGRGLYTRARAPLEERISYVQENYNAISSGIKNIQSRSDIERRLKMHKDLAPHEALARVVHELELEGKSLNRLSDSEVTSLRKRKGEIEKELKSVGRRRKTRKMRLKTKNLEGKKKELIAEKDNIDSRLAKHETAIKAAEETALLEEGVSSKELEAKVEKAKKELVDSRAERTVKAAKAVIDSHSKSAGAAQTPVRYQREGAYTKPDSSSKPYEMLLQAIDLGRNIPRNIALKVFGGKAVRRKLQSAYTTFNESKGIAIRGLGAMLAPNPQMTSKGVTNAAASSERVWSQLMVREGGREAEALVAYTKELGLSAKETQMFLMGEGKHRAEFDNQVVLAMQGGSSVSSAINQAAIARSETLGFGLKTMQESGVVHFEGVEADPKYWPLLFSTNKVEVAYTGHGRPAIIAVISKAYQTGKHKIPKEAADLIAAAQYERAMHRGTHAAGNVQSLMQGGNRELLAAELKKSGVKDSVIDALLSDLEDATEKVTMNARAKFSLGANLKAEVNGLRMVDLMDTSQDVLVRYNKDVAGSTGIAEKGFGSRQELVETINLAEKTDKNQLLWDKREASGEIKRLQALLKKGDTSQVKEIKAKIKEAEDLVKAADRSLKELDEDIKEMHDLVSLVFKESLDLDNSGGISGTVATSRAVRKATNILSLGHLGFTVIPEHVRLMMNNGIGVYLSKFPKAMHSGLGKKRVTEDLEDVINIAGTIGSLENSLLRNTYSMRSAGEEAGGLFSRTIDKVMNKASDTVSLLSFFRGIQNTGENIAMEASLARLHRAAEGRLKYTEADLAPFYNAGMTKKDFAKVISHIKANRYKGKDGTNVANLSSLEPELRNKLGNALRAVWHTDMQRGTTGETSIWTNKEVGRVLTQFRGYSLLSVEKQLIAGVSTKPVQFALQTMMTSAIGFLVYKARVETQAASKEDPRKFIEEKMQTDNILRGMAAFSPQLGSLGFVYDVMDFAQIPSPLAGEGGSSKFMTRAGTGSVPLLGTADKILGGGGSVGGLVSSLIRGDAGKEEMAEYSNRLNRLNPLANTTAVVLGTSILKGLSE